MPKHKLRTKRKSANHPSFQEMKRKSDVVPSSQIGLKLMNVDRLINYKFLAYFFKRPMQGRVSCRLDLATSIQEHKYAVYRTLSVLLTVTNDIITLTTVSLPLKGSGYNIPIYLVLYGKTFQRGLILRSFLSIYVRCSIFHYNILISGKYVKFAWKSLNCYEG